MHTWLEDILDLSLDKWAKNEQGTRFSKRIFKFLEESYISLIYVFLLGYYAEMLNCVTNLLGKILF